MISLNTGMSSIRAVFLYLFHACSSTICFEFSVFHHCTGCREDWVQELAKGVSFILPILQLCLSNGAYLTDGEGQCEHRQQHTHSQHYIYSLSFSPGNKFIQCNVWDLIRNFFFFFDSLNRTVLCCRGQTKELLIKMLFTFRYV